MIGEPAERHGLEHDQKPEATVWNLDQQQKLSNSILQMLKICLKKYSYYTLSQKMAALL